MNPLLRHLLPAFFALGFSGLVVSTHAQNSFKCGEALISFFREISPDGNTDVPDYVTKALQGSVLSYSQSIKIFAVDVESHPKLYKFWHEENAEFLFGDPDLLLKPTSNYYFVSVARPAGWSYHCRLNWDTYEIEAVYWIPEG